MPYRPSNIALSVAAPDSEPWQTGNAGGNLKLYDEITKLLTKHQDEMRQQIENWMASEERAIHWLALSCGKVDQMGQPGRHWGEQDVRASTNLDSVAEGAESDEHQAEQLSDSSAGQWQSGGMLSNSIEAQDVSSRGMVAADNVPHASRPAEKNQDDVASFSVPTTVDTGQGPAVRRSSLIQFLKIISTSSKHVFDSFGSLSGSNVPSTNADGNERRASFARTSKLSKTFSQEMAERYDAAKRSSRQVRLRRSTTEEDTPLSTAPQPCLKHLVTANYFEHGIAFLIVTNSIFIGIEVNHAVTHLETKTPIEFELIGHAYAGMFLLELLIRLAAYRLSFFYSKGWAWNWLDFILVFSSIVEVAALIATGGSDANDEKLRSFTALRILRIARVVRVMRIVRVLQFFRQLRILAYSIIGTLKSLMWALLLQCIIIYLFAILFTQACSELSSRTFRSSGLWDHYRSLPRSAYTLFLSMTSGISWDQAASPLEELGWLYMLIFMAYISFMLFAVMNVVTGVFCQTAIESAEREADDYIAERLRAKKTHVERLKALFEQLSPDGGDELILGDLEQHMDDKNVREFFEAMDIDVSDAFSLYLLLDHDNTHRISIEMFVEGCLKLKGQRGSMDLARIKLQNEWLVKKIGHLSSFVEANFSVLQASFILPNRLGIPSVRISQSSRQSSRYQGSASQSHDT